MEQFKRAQVIILSTQDNNSQLAINLGVGEFIGQKIPKGDLCISSSKGWSNAFRPQHLYIISDDEIKEGDWYLDISLKTSEYAINKCDSKRLELISKEFKNKFKKIIATTDKLYTQGYTPLGCSIGIPLPQPSQQFIEKYIEEYNKGNIIIDVLIEYTCNQCNLTRNIHNGMFEVDCDKCNYKKGNEYPDLEINPKDNTITIKKLKDSWNREEVENLLYKITEDFSSSSRLTTYFRSKTDNWIKENL